jgi:hypothetical protein
MLIKLKKDYSTEYQKWERFRVIKRFTWLPLRIELYTAQTIWWSWLETTYILQDWEVDNGLRSYLFGGYWKNCRVSWVEEYNDYVAYKNQNNQK